MTQPPASEVPGLSGISGIVDGRRAVAVVHDFQVWPSGLGFAVDIRLRPRAGTFTDVSYGGWPPLGDRPATVTLTAAFDGRRTVRAEVNGTPEAGAGMAFRGSAGGGEVWSSRWWLWPLPVGSELAIRVVCVELGLDGSVTVPVPTLVELGARAQPIAPYEGES